MKKEMNEWVSILIALAFIAFPIVVGVLISTPSGSGNSHQTSER